MPEKLYDLELVVYWHNEGEAVPVLRIENITAEALAELISLADYPGGSTAGWRAKAREEVTELQIRAALEARGHRRRDAGHEEGP